MKLNGIACQSIWNDQLLVLAFYLERDQTEKVLLRFDFLCSGEAGSLGANNFLKVTLFDFLFIQTGVLSN